ncbi:hypothetical protein T230_05425 [Tannerella sp. oral taxon BU063 isolate Cell 1/3]|uniref:Uncharacterized protein n=1 Tax=Tannerella sp. oral taxon BU063 isolate Cell 1/3 TaxID=1411022 RepID=W2CPL3_9BACT|nr:hypothetical protein T230_05425 [Tannerella sp. oral taxon BU063 isolate Cell 1/3]
MLIVNLHLLVEFAQVKFWGLLVPISLGVFRYRLLGLTCTKKLHFYVELTLFIPRATTSNFEELFEIVDIESRGE